MSTAHPLHDPVARVRAIIERAGIEIIQDRDLPTACARQHKGHYQIALGALYDRLQSPEARAALMLHELHHVLRGDCLVRVERRDLANVAMDACIHDVLHHRYFAALGRECEALGVRPVTWALLYARHPDLPPVGAGWRAIYDYLLAHEDDAGQAAGDEAIEGDDDMTGDGSVTRAQHAATAAKARQAIREAAQDALEDWREALQATAKSIGIDLGASGCDVPESPPIMPDPRLSALLAALRAGERGATLVRARTYTRPGRVPGLRGTARQPRARVAVAIDCSGSMDAWIAAASALADGLRKTHDVALVRWADRWATDSADVGGGTRVACLLKCPHVMRADLAIVVTDGYVDAAEASAVQAQCRQCAWVLTPDGSPSELPAGAMIIETRQ